MAGFVIIKRASLECSNEARLLRMLTAARSGLLLDPFLRKDTAGGVVPNQSIRQEQTDGFIRPQIPPLKMELEIWKQGV